MKKTSRAGSVAAGLLLAVALTSCGREPAAKDLDSPQIPETSTGYTSIAPSSEEIPVPGAPTSAGQGRPGGTVVSPPGRSSRPGTGPGTGPGQGQGPPSSAPGGPGNPCGKPPAGTAADGRAQQRIVFTPPGTHQWPDVDVTFRACATSGLPVGFQLQNGGRGGSCWAATLTGATTRAQSVPLTCEVTATQAGNAAFAPAQPVVLTWMVNKLAVKIGWLGSADTLVYTAGKVVTLQARVTAMHDIPPLMIYTRAEGACSIAEAPDRTGGTGGAAITFGVRVALLDPGAQPGSCDLRVAVDSNHIAIGSYDTRHYVVRR
ncbi:hypothetical protein [Amycolatopsis azurea]|uniref:Uncharacterized protein n=1 Tax=Amycolatopsis azurea DSM 43854 TaxID=1238180 RepID=M2NPM6_9PSEU|nr:hypothetical protein [Amycolatopsis azurea]EMD24214.1 hypothetical protein C791_6292 [Amycolatopsis azurea DSM 43854]OOC07964.1 hypothetical protein B0293_03500 [Amycolatopsis azurea DSM 43854]